MSDEDTRMSLFAERARARLEWREKLLEQADTALEQAREFARKAAGGDERKAARLLREWLTRNPGPAE